jgi:DNA-binding transcriptional LysR family regulator
VADRVGRCLVDRGGEGGRGRTASLGITPAGRTLLRRARRSLATVDERLFADPALDVVGTLGLRLGPPSE